MKRAAKTQDEIVRSREMWEATSTKHLVYVDETDCSDSRTGCTSMRRDQEIPGLFFRFSFVFSFAVLFSLSFRWSIFLFLFFFFRLFFLPFSCFPPSYSACSFTYTHTHTHTHALLLLLLPLLLSFSSFSFPSTSLFSFHSLHPLHTRTHTRTHTHTHCLSLYHLFIYLSIYLSLSVSLSLSLPPFGFFESFSFCFACYGGFLFWEFSLRRVLALWRWSDWCVCASLPCFPFVPLLCVLCCVLCLLCVVVVYVVCVLACSLPVSVANARPTTTTNQPPQQHCHSLSFLPTVSTLFLLSWVVVLLSGTCPPFSSSSYSCFLNSFGSFSSQIS